jgi:hypothetical protein
MSVVSRPKSLLPKVARERRRNVREKSSKWEFSWIAAARSRGFLDSRTSNGLRSPTGSLSGFAEMAAAGESSF